MPSRRFASDPAGDMSGDAAPRAVEALAFDDPAGRWVLAATVLGSSLAFLDATVVNIALPAIRRDLGAGVAGLTWTVNAYTLTLAAFVLVAGSLGDRFGRRRIFIIGVAWFGAASLACAVATGVEALVAFRALQGVGGALLTPGALAIIQSAFRAEDRSRAIGAWSGLAGLTGAVGPFLGGWLVAVGSWRWIFLINLPVVLAVLAIAAWHVPESRDSQASGRVDLFGVALAAGGLGLLTFGLSVWPEHGPGSSQVQIGVGLALVCLLSFVVWERTATNPMLPLGIFSVPQLGVINLVTFLVYAALAGVFLWLVLTLQVVAGWTALQAGLSLLPVTVLMLALSPRAGAIGDRLGPRLPMTVGLLLAAAGVAALTRIGPEASYLSDVVVPVTLLGLGLTLTVTPLTATALGAVPEARAGLASGVNNAVARTGSLLLIAVLPALTGLDKGGLGNAAIMQHAFGTAMVTCAVLLALGGMVSALFIRSAPVAAETQPPVSCPRYHFCVDGPPIAVSRRTSPRR
jgi:EmrB/QacA subfamily drug resistance transporter